jgi:p-aminobenzoyl-glutamate transporter AbgT
MKWIIIGLFVFLLAFSPAYVTDKLVMPKLQSLKNTYGNADTIAQEAAFGTEAK